MATAGGSAFAPPTPATTNAPTPSQIAEHLKISREEVFEGFEATNAHHSLSLDYLLTDDPDSASLADTLGADDPELSVVDAREALYPLIKKLPERQQKIITLRFFGNLTQTQIAETLGISQMHVSRLIRRALEKIRDEIASEEGGESAPRRKRAAGGKLCAFLKAQPTSSPLRS